MDGENEGARMAAGLTACAIASVFFGSMYVPFKKFNAGDGFFSQWVMCCAILLAGFVTFVYEGFPKFYPLAMLGGAFWTIGNTMAIPAIRRIGMALAILIWNTALCLTGWATGRFGLFGMTARPPKNALLNYIGLGMVLIGGVLFSQVRSEPAQKSPTEKSTTVKLLKDKNGDSALINEKDEAINQDTDTGEPNGTEEAFSAKQRLLGICLALGIGVCFGSNLIPVIHIQDNPDKFPNAPPRGMPYVFSHYFGIFVTGTIIFLGYSIVKKNRPHVERELVIPAAVSGLLWSVAQTAVFVANEKLSQTIVFPIVGCLPSVVAVVWSVFVFHEIRGARNLKILAVAIAIAVGGVLLVGISKDVEF